MVQTTFEVTSTNFKDQVLGASQPVLVEFGADWCPPCKMLAPAIQALAAKYAGRLGIGTVDADEYPEFIQRYGVMGLPTLILFQNGEPVKRIVGYQPRERIEAQIVPYLQPENVKS